jgi:PIN domain nuclease of toxin-antitoxin system
MRLLLDTNTLLWMLTGSPRIEPARKLIESGENDVFISSVSWWEIAIKIGTGKLQVDISELRTEAAGCGLAELPLLGRHAETLASLPKFHKDPFDRMLIAQAISEPMRFVTGDSLLTKYTELAIVI